MGVVARKGTDLHIAPSNRDATGCGVPVGWGEHRTHDPAPLRGEVIHEIGQLHGKIAALRPPPALQFASAGMCGHAQSQGKATGRRDGVA